MAFKNDARYYRHNGKMLPSVTTITGQLHKPALTAWAANCACDYLIAAVEKADAQDMVPVGALYSAIERARREWRKVSAKALDVGSAVHAAIERYVQDGEVPEAPGPEVKSAFTAFLEWWRGHDIEPLFLEQTLYGDDHAGTTDFIGRFNGQLYVIDWKSSKGIYDEMRYQVAAYRSLADPMIAPEIVLGCGILRLDKSTGMPEWVDTSETYQQDLLVFDALARLWHARYPDGGCK